MRRARPAIEWTTVLHRLRDARGRRMRCDERQAIEIPLDRRRRQALLMPVCGAILEEPNGVVAKHDLRVDRGLANAAQALGHRVVHMLGRPTTWRWDVHWGSHFVEYDSDRVIGPAESH